MDDCRMKLPSGSLAPAEAEERAEKRWRQKFEDSLPNFDFRALFSL